MDWIEILKVKQITTPTTDINIKKIPKKKGERDCCQEAKDRYKRHHSRSRFRDYDEDKDGIENYDYMYTALAGEPGGFANKSCEKFREFLEDVPGHRYEPDSEYGKILREWNKCEGRD
jgi:hypothetical protein